MKSDKQIKHDVERELEWDPAIDASSIGVEVTDGVVTLAGHLNSYAEKQVVQKAVQRVEGVSGAVLELDVRLPDDDRRTDADIVSAARILIRWLGGINDDAVKVTVERGTVTLSGEVEWEYQRRLVEKYVARMRGVTHVINLVTISHRVVASDIADRIKDALMRHAEREAKHISVDVHGDTVTLRGKVDSLSQRASTRAVAWSAPGVRAVIDELRVND